MRIAIVISVAIAALRINDYFSINQQHRTLPSCLSTVRFRNDNPELRVGAIPEKKFERLARNRRVEHFLRCGGIFSRKGLSGGYITEIAQAANLPKADIHY
ncbi:hypothetical protein [Kozakia baliensis]|uniref:hypothetical protein n=1 Tax=Kozakia baliensis TaxID=153496 RepID=UPI0012688242|nr:hypothetical protein [Kozakia baliensis]